jgi:hypothetical protein
MKVQTWLDCHVAGVVTGRRGTASKRKGALPTRLPAQTLATNDEAAGRLDDCSTALKTVMQSSLVPSRQQSDRVPFADTAAAAAGAPGRSPQPAPEASPHASDAASTAPPVPPAKKVCT